MWRRVACHSPSTSTESIRLGSFYSDQRTWLHAVSAPLKLLLLAVFGTALYVLDSAAVLLACSALCLLHFASLGRATLPARKLLVMVFLTGLLITAFHAYMQQPLLGLVSALRLLSASLLGISLMLTTRSHDLLDVLESCLSPLNRFGIKSSALALQIALMLRFTEHFFIQWKRLDDAHRVRTGKSGGFKLLAPLTIRMLTTAQRVADALELRLAP
jgi:biotin transport system permease protein